MIITMQGNWTVRVKSKNATFPQRFIIAGALFGNGTYSGVTTTPEVQVFGNQWTIAIQNDPGTGFQLSDAKLTFPVKSAGKYQFDIQSDDAGGDGDFNDIVLTCSTTATINDFILFGNVTLYSGRCLFNPCRKRPYVIETYPALVEALKHKDLRYIIEKYYPERVPVPGNPNPPDPGPYFKPIVIDLSGELTQPKTLQVYKQLDTAPSSAVKAKGKDAGEPDSEFAESNFRLEKSIQTRSLLTDNIFAGNKANVAKAIEGLYRFCEVDGAAGITLTFEEYDRTDAEKTGGAYTGTGNRQLLGDTITDMFGNYIFRFRFDMTFPGVADSTDFAVGEDFNVVAYPDVIVKVTGVASWDVLYESAPYFNIPNLKRIDLCLPKSVVHVTSSCFNGSLIGSLGNVFIGGNQNTGASTVPATLRRYGDNNFLEADGKISVNSPLAGFSTECAAWAGTIDMKGCMYDVSKPASANKIRWYTIRIKRAGTSGWAFVSENYKHPQYSKRNLANYTGDDVGSFPVALRVDGGPVTTVPAYKNINAEVHIDGIDWENTNLDRFIQLNTGLYDVLLGEHTPGTFYVRVDGYDAAGNLLAGETDMIALYIHNRDLNFGLSGPVLTDPSVLNAGCGLYRLTDAQMNTPMALSFMANDPYGFVDNFHFTTGRCPAPTIALTNSPMPNTLAGAGVLSEGHSVAVHNACPAYTGTLAEFGTTGLIPVTIQPGAGETGWIKAGEYFTVYSFALSAQKRVTNGYNSGISGVYQQYGQIMMERLNP